jgi:hypothetical protein
MPISAALVQHLSDSTCTRRHGPQHTRQPESLSLFGDLDISVYD